MEEKAKKERRRREIRAKIRIYCFITRTINIIVMKAPKIVNKEEGRRKGSTNVSGEVK